MKNKDEDVRLENLPSLMSKYFVSCGIGGVGFCIPINKIDSVFILPPSVVLIRLKGGELRKIHLTMETREQAVQEFERIQKQRE